MTPTGVGSLPQAQWEVQPVVIATRSGTEEVPLMTTDEQSGRTEPEQNTEQASNTDATERAKEQMREALNRKEDADHPNPDGPRDTGPVPNTGPITGTDAADEAKRTFIPRKT